MSNIIRSCYGPGEFFKMASMKEFASGLPARWQRFCDALTGAPSPEEQERRRVEEELCRAFCDEYGQFIGRYRALGERNRYQLGQIGSMRSGMLQPRSGMHPSRDAMKSAIVDEIKELDRLTDDWTTLLDDFLAFFKKAKPPMEPEDLFGYARQADGIAKAQMDCRDMRKAFKAAAIQIRASLRGGAGNSRRNRSACQRDEAAQAAHPVTGEGGGRLPRRRNSQQIQPQTGG
jgi:hypothetical protein